MKKITTITLLLIINLSMFAQPSAATMMAKIKSSEKNIISAVWNGQPKSERILEDGIWNNYYRRSYKVKRNTKYKGITEEYSGGIQYKKKGGTYAFDQFLIGSVEYKNVPNPNKAEILKMIKADLNNYLGQNHLNDIVGEISEITFAANPEWYWRKLTFVEFYTKVTYSEKVSYTEIEKAEHYYRVTMLSDEYKKPWKSFQSVRMGDRKKVLSKTKYTSEEVKAMPSLMSTQQTNRVNDYFASLPKTDKIPVFESDKQLFYYVHNIILTKTAKEVEAYLYKLQSKSCYQRGSDVFRTVMADKWVNKVRDNVDIFKKSFCEYPKEKRYVTGTISFYDKQNKLEIEYSAYNEAGTWKLSNIRYPVASKSDANLMANMNTNCQEKPDLTVRKIVQYKVGDKVHAKFSNGTFDYVINKRDGTNDRYYVKAEGNPDGRGYWMPEANLTPRTGSEKANKTNTEEKTKTADSTPKTVSFNVGDEVKIKTKSGYLTGKLIKYASRRYLVKFDSKKYRDTWYLPNQMEKK